MSTGAAIDSIATPTLWLVTIGALLVLLALDFVITRRPHEVSMREALRWSVFYIALPLAFGGFVWWRYGSTRGLEYLTGYLVEKSLSVDNLFVFMLLLAAFAVPLELQQRVLLYGIIGALILRAVFIAIGAVALAAFDWTFLVFGLILIATAARVVANRVSNKSNDVDVDALRIVRLTRRFVPVTPNYHGPRMLGRIDDRIDGRRALTPFALVVLAVLSTDVVFAVDSVPAVYGITGDPFLVFITNAFALLGLRALYFVLQGALNKLVHLDYGLAVILAFIGIKLALHWAHQRWEAVPEIPTLASLAVITGILTITAVTSQLATRRRNIGTRQAFCSPGRSRTYTAYLSRFRR